MPGVLPPTLPSSHPSTGAPFGLPKPNIKSSVFSDERKQAVVSIHQKEVGDNRPSTSITHIGAEGETATTSVAREQQHAARTSIYGEERQETDPGQDERRYDYIRRIVRARQAKQAAEAEEQAAQKAASASQGGIFHPGKGAGFGKVGFHKKIRSFFSDNREKYKNISVEDRQVLENIVSERATHKSVGQGFTGRDKRQMRLAAKRAKLRGEISKEDVKDFTKIISSLE